MAAIRLGRWSATMELATRLEWRPAHSGSVAVTWTRAPEHRPGILSAWNGSWRLTHLTARRIKATRLKRLILQTIPGAARFRRGASWATSCKRLLKLRKPLAFRWWWPPAMTVRLAAASTPSAMVPKPGRRHGTLHPTRSGRWSMAPIPLLALAAVALLLSMAVTVRSRISLLPARAFARLGTVPTATMQLFRAHPWRLRTLPEPRRCYGLPFRV